MPGDGYGLPCTLKACSCCCTLALVCTAAGGTGGSAAPFPRRGCSSKDDLVIQAADRSKLNRAPVALALQPQQAVPSATVTL